MNCQWQLLEFCDLQGALLFLYLYGPSSAIQNLESVWDLERPQTKPGSELWTLNATDRLFYSEDMLRLVQHLPKGLRYAFVCHHRSKYVQKCVFHTFWKLILQRCISTCHSLCNFVTIQKLGELVNVSSSTICVLGLHFASCLSLCRSKETFASLKSFWFRCSAIDRGPPGSIVNKGDKILCLTIWTDLHRATGIAVYHIRNIMVRIWCGFGYIGSGYFPGCTGTASSLYIRTRYLKSRFYIFFQYFFEAIVQNVANSFEPLVYVSHASNFMAVRNMRVKYIQIFW